MMTSSMKQTGVVFPIEIFDGRDIIRQRSSGRRRYPQDATMSRIPRTTLVTTHDTATVTTSRHAQICNLKLPHF